MTEPDLRKSEAIPKKRSYGMQHLKVVRIEEEVGGNRCYYLAPNPQKGTTHLAEFRAGQYLSVLLKFSGRTLSRPYSIASSPREAREGFYMLTIQRVEDGLASCFIHDNWQVGTEVTVSEPLGHFTCASCRNAGTIVALVGGGCITPVRSLAMAIADGEEDVNLILLYGTGTLQETMFQKDLKALESKCPRIRLVNVLCDEVREGCEHGFITAQLIRKYAPLDAYVIFICGPQDMRRFVENEVQSLCIPQSRVCNELYGEYFTAAPEGAAVFRLTVRMDGGERTVAAPSGMSLLRTLEENGFEVPARCRSGECGWCRTKLISGDVCIPQNVDGRIEAERACGYIHPCYSFPRSDLVIKVPEQE